MKTQKTWFRLAAGCVLAVGLLAGCESGSSSSTVIGGVSLTPASVYLTAGKINTVTLSASGGDSNYTWSVSSTNLGMIYAMGDAAAYVSTTNAGVNTVIVTDGNHDGASAVITQQ